MGLSPFSMPEREVANGLSHSATAYRKFLPFTPVGVFVGEILDPCKVTVIQLRVVKVGRWFVYLDCGRNVRGHLRDERGE